MIRTPLNRRNSSLIRLSPPPRVKNRANLSSDSHNYFPTFLSQPPLLTFFQVFIIHRLQAGVLVTTRHAMGLCTARRYKLFSNFSSCQSLPGCVCQGSVQIQMKTAVGDDYKRSSLVTQRKKNLGNTTYSAY